MIFIHFLSSTLPSRHGENEEETQSGKERNRRGRGGRKECIRKRMRVFSSMISHKGKFKKRKEKKNPSHNENGESLIKKPTNLNQKK